MASPTRYNRRTERVFKVQGQGYKNTDGDDNPNIETNSGEEESDREPTKTPVPPDHTDLVRRVMGVNKRLVQKIEILRMRLDIDRKHNDAAFQETATSYARKLTQRESDIKQLQTKLDEKEKSVGKLKVKNSEKIDEVFLLQKHIDELQKEVEDSRSRADEMYSEIDMLRKDREKKYMNMDPSSRDDEIRSLVNELKTLRKNLDLMENELKRANETMKQHGGKIRILENEKRNLEVKFKEELERVSVNLKCEIEKMRDVMQKQWEEMRGLREQNVQMSSDIREIKEMLVKSREGRDGDSNKKSQASDTDREYRPGYLIGFQPTLPAQRGRGRFVNKNKY